MTVVGELLPRRNPDGAVFVSSGLRTTNDAEVAFAQAHEFEQLAFSGKLQNPRAALSRAHELLEIAAEASG